MKTETYILKNRKLVALFFSLIAIVLGLIFFLEVDVPQKFEGYFSKAYYGQFGAVAICVELLAASYYLFKGHKKSNFTMALFAFTALLAIILNIFGWSTIMMPLYALILFFVCAVLALWIAFSNAFDLGKISIKMALLSFVLGNAIELYFNYF